MNGTSRNYLLPLVAGAGILLLSVWMFALHLGDTLARLHVEQKMESLAAQARDVLARHQDAEARLLLKGLMRFREVEALRVHAPDGAVLFAWPENFRARAPERLAPGEIRQYAAQLESYTPIKAISRQRTMLKGKPLDVIARLDITGIVASYRQIAILVAKMISVVLLAAFLAIGVLLMRRRRQQRLDMPGTAEIERLEALHTQMATALRWQAALMRSAPAPRAGTDKKPQDQRQRAG